MQDNRRYAVQVPGASKVQYWDSERYERNKDKLYEQFPDTQVVEMRDADLGNIEEKESYVIDVPGAGGLRLWDGAKLARNREKLLEQFPEAKITTARHTDYYGDKLRDIYGRMDILEQELRGLPAETSVPVANSSAGAVLMPEPGLTEEQKTQRRRRREINEELTELKRQREDNPVWKSYLQREAHDAEANIRRLEQVSADLRAKHGKEMAGRPINVFSTASSAGTPVSYDSDPAYTAAQEALEAARLYYKDISKTVKAPSKYGGDAKGAMSDFWQGAVDGLPKALSVANMIRSGLNIHLIDAVKAIQDHEADGEKTNIINLVENDGIDKADYLNTGQKELVKAFVKKAETDGTFSDRISKSYQAGQGAVQSLGFMADFVLAGGVGGGVANAVTGGVTKAAKAGTNTLAKVGAEALYCTVKALAMTPVMPSSAANFADGMLQLNDAGSVDVSGKAIARAAGDVIIENISETVGSAPLKIAGIPLQKVRFPDWVKALGNSTVAQSLKQAGYNGFFEEMVEEWTGNALRVMTGVDRDALKNFATVEQQLITAGSFAPMSLVGIPGSAVRFSVAKKSYADAGAHLEKIIDATDEKKRQAIRDAVAATGEAETPEDLGGKMADIYRQLVDGGADERKAFTAALRYTQEAAQYKLQAGAMEEARDVERAAKQLAINVSVGGENWYHKGRMGENRVRVITDEKGEQFFVVAEENNTLALVDMSGGRRMASADMVSASVEAGLMKDRDALLSEYLDGLSFAEKQAAEQERMHTERQEADRQVTQLSEPGMLIPMGTAEDRVDGTVVEWSGGKCIVQMPDGTTQELSADEVANRLGVDIHPRTDAEIDEETQNYHKHLSDLKSAANGSVGGKFKMDGLECTLCGVTYNTEPTEGDKPVVIYYKDAQGNSLSASASVDQLEQIVEEVSAGAAQNATEEEEESAEAQNSGEEAPAQQDTTPRDFRGNPLPLRQNAVTGEYVVDEDVLWNNDPEAWVRYNDANPSAVITSAEKVESAMDGLDRKIADIKAALRKAALEGGRQDAADKLGGELQRLSQRRAVLEYIRVRQQEKAMIDEYDDLPPDESGNEYVPVKTSGEKEYMKATQRATYEDIYSDESFADAGESYGFISGRVKNAKRSVEHAQKALDRVLKDNRNGRYASAADFAAAKKEASDALATAMAEQEYWAGVMDIADNEEAAAKKSASDAAARREDERRTPKSLHELVADAFIGYQHRLNRESFRKETGYGDSDMRKFFQLWARKGQGASVYAMAEEIAANDELGLVPVDDNGLKDTRAVVDAILDVFASAQSPSDLYNYTRNANLAREEEERRYQDELAERYAEEERQEAEAGETGKTGANPQGHFQYFNGTLHELISAAKSKVKGLFKMVLAPVSTRLESELKAKGVEINNEYRHTIDNNAITHTLNQHGSESEEKRGQIPVTEADFERIPEVVENYDDIKVETGKRGLENIVYSKIYPDGTTIYVEEVRSGKKELAAVTMWKKKNPALTGANREDTTPIPDLSRASASKDTKTPEESNTYGRQDEIEDLPSDGLAERSAEEERSKEKSNQEEETYKLSDEVDENGRQFVLNSEGNISFGEITQETGLKSAPILLSEGLITNPATNDGYGLVHIEARHGDQIREAGFKSVVDFIEAVARNYETIREGNIRDGIQTYLIQLRDKHNNTLMVELSGDGTYWNVNTAGIFKTSYGAKRKEVYSRHTTAGQTAESVEESQDKEQRSTTSSSSMNSSILSASKDTKTPEESNTYGRLEAEGNRPDNNGVVGRSLSEDETIALIDGMRAHAEAAQEMELTPENWTAQFGENGEVETPLGKVTMGENQYFKLAQQGRKGKLRMVKQTLQTPFIVVEDFREDKSEKGERFYALVFIKTFRKENGDRYYHFTSVTVSKDGREVVISNQEKSANRISKLLQQGKVAWISSEFSLHPKAQVEESVPLDDSNKPTMPDSQSALLGISSSELPWDNLSASKDTKTPEESNTYGRQDEIEDLPSDEDLAVMEENRRQEPLKERVRQWEERLGVKITVHTSLDDVKNKQAREEITEADAAVANGAAREKNRVNGWYNTVTGEVELYLPHILSEEEIDARVMHEVVAHRGLRELLGTEMKITDTDRRGLLRDSIARFEVQRREGGAPQKTAEAENTPHSAPAPRGVDEESAESITDEIKPIGKGAFGDIYDAFKGKVKEAFDFLLKHKEGDLLGVFHREDIGDIDLVWGNEDMGLAHILDKHVGNGKDFATQEEMFSAIEKNINKGDFIQDNKNRYVLSLDEYRVGIRKDFNGEKKNWVVTAVDYNRSKKEKGIATNPTSASLDVNGPEFAAPNNTSSTGKGSNSSEESNTPFANDIFADTLSNAPEELKGRITVRESSTGDEQEENFVQSYDIDGKPSGISRIELFDAKPSENPTRFVIDGSDVDAETAEQDKWESLAVEYHKTHPDVKLYVGDESGIGFATFKDAYEFHNWANEHQSGAADRQGNPLNADGTLKVDVISSIDKLTDEDFTNPTRNVQLPELPKNVDSAIGADGKPVVIKKSIFERNKDRHADLTAQQSREILSAALYDAKLYGQTQAKSRPYNWVVIALRDEGGNNRLVLLEVNDNKDNVEIVHWHFVDEKGLEKLKKQAKREDGQLLILPSAKEEAGALSSPTQGSYSNENQAERNGGELIMLSKGKVESLSTPAQSLSSDGKGTNNSERNNAASEDKKESAKKDDKDRIEDVGEKIGGAKKDKFKEGMKRVQEDSARSDTDLISFIASTPISKIFGFDLAKFREGGVSNEAVSFVQTVKKFLPAKPRTQWKLRRWTSNILSLYRTSLEALSNWDSVNGLLNSEAFASTALKRRYDAYMAVGGFDGGLNIGDAELTRLTFGAGTYDKNGKWISHDGYWGVTKAGKYSAHYPTKEEAVAALKAFAGENAISSEKGKEKEIKFVVYRRTADNSLYITPKGKSELVIADGFKSAEDAFKYLKEHNEELQERYRTLMDGTKTEFGENRERKGRDYRAGKDIGADEFRETFGFRGVEFGNWMTQADRAKALNECYDALMDLADVCGVSPKALSLDGKLAMAFGARGGGQFNAHYEPGKVVINMTKTRGAGSLAHEWFHAVDNYFARMGGANADGFATSKQGINPGIQKYRFKSGEEMYYDGKAKKYVTKEEYDAAVAAHSVRKEMAEAWAHLIDAIAKSDYGTRSRSYASLHHSNYWNKPTEMGARAFSVWVENQLSKRNAVNDYLANNPKLLEEALSDDTKKYSPYPFNTDADWMDEAFGNLFSTMEERTDENTGNVALFQVLNEALGIKDPAQQLAFDVVSQMLSDAGIPVEQVSNETMRQMAEGTESTQLMVKLNSLIKAANAIRGWLANNMRGKSFTIELPEYTQKMIRREMGRNFDTHLITANSIVHAKKNHGENGQKLTKSSIPLKDEDFTLAPYIMTAPDRIVRGSEDITGRESIRFEKTLSNGVVIVVEKEQKNSPNDMETITMWAESSSSNVADAHSKRMSPTIDVPGVIISSDDVAKIIKDAENAIASDNEMQLMTVYHGSGAKFDKFDSAFMGTGEGAQAYGWGHYVTEVESIGKIYADASTMINGGSSLFERVIAYIKKRMRAGSSFEEARNTIVGKLESLFGRNAEKAEYASTGETIERLKNLSESDIPQSALYTIDIPEDTGENYLSYDGRLSEDVVSPIADKLSKIGWKREDDGHLIRLKKGGNVITLNSMATGADLYAELQEAFGSDKAASEFLGSIGYAGIKYPTNFRSGGNAEGTSNYVIFKDSDLKIVDRVAFLRDGAVVYGAAVGGKIYLNAERLNPNTPIHEYTHLWDKACAKSNPELWNRGVELMKQTSLWKEVENDPNYAGLDEEGIASEVHARLTGEHGAELLERLSKEALEGEGGILGGLPAVNVIHRLRGWLSDFWQWVKDTMAPWSRSEAAKVSIEDFVNMPIADLAKGTRLSENQHTAEEQLIIDNAMKDGTYMKAPNGKLSNLSERQWVQVRTKSFKKWFGDWEKATRIEKLRKSEAAKISGDEIPITEDYKQNQKNALKAGKSIRATYVNADTGKEINLMSGKHGGLKEILNHDYKDVEHIQSIAAIPQIIEKGIYIDTVQNEEKGNNPSIDAYEYYVCGLKIGGIDYLVKAVIGIDDKGNRYYDHKLTRIEKGKLLAELANQPIAAQSGLSSEGTQGDAVGSISADGNAESNKSPLSGVKDKRLLSILQNNSSKVVDENGEPRVVYHGTTRDEETSRWNEELKSFDTEHSPFTVFRRKVDGERNSGFFFNSEKDNAYGYGYNTYDTFLDLKNPLVIDCKGSSYDAITFKGETRDTYEWARYAEQSGYDGVVFSNVADGTDYGAMSKTSTDYVAFSPNQIKSATDNVGTFDTENDDIRFSIVTDKKEIERLNSEPTIKVYRAMQLRDGKLYPPMAGKVNGKWQQGIAVEDLGKVWEKADEYPELADEKGRFTLNKGNGTSLKARYNPYIHTSTTPLNDQFSSAQSRPELVTVEVEIPESELTSGYKAEKAKDNVGKVEWKAGAVQGQLTGTREVILSRWDKPVCIVPESEVADRIMEMFDGKDITMPSNVVTPALREELEKRGVPFVETDNQGRPVEQSEDIEKVNAKFNEQLGTLTEKNADRISLSLGSPSDLLLSAGVKDKPMKLYGNKVMQKMRKHGFALEELRNLPEAVSNPIAVFNNYGKDGNHSILTELRTRQGNILVSVSIGEDADVDFNIVRSVFGKRDANVVDWINKGLATYINKEKALSFLSHQSAPIAATAANAELSTATKVVESFVNPSEDIEKVNAKFNEELQKQIEGNLPDGHIYQLGKLGETLLSTGVPNLPIQMSATKLEEKSSKVGHNYDLNEVRDLVNALQHPLAVFAYGNKEKSQNIIVPLQKDGKNFIVGLSLSPIVGGRRLEINSVRNVFPKDNAEWLNWITQGKALYIDKTKIQTLIDQQRTILADVEYLDLDSVTKVVESFVNPSEDIEKVNAKFNGELQKQIEGTLPNGHIYKIGLPGAILQSAGFPNTPIELGATRLAEKAAQRNHEFEIGDVKDLVKSINDPIAVFAYGDKNKAQNVIVGLERDGKHFVVGIHFNQKRRGSEVSDIRGLFNKDNAEWLNWISQGKSLYLNKAKIQTLIDKQRTNLAEVEYLDLDSVTKIVDRFENANIGRTIFSRQKAEEAAVSLGTEMVDLDRYRSANDAVREMLETSVEKKGLPAVLGRDGMRGYVLDIFRAMPEEQRRLVAASAVNGFGGDIVAAMQKDLADRAVARDLTTNIDKEKALDYRHLSALRAVTSESPRLSSATEVVDNSDNPNIPEGNISRDIWDIAGNALEDALGTRGVEVSLNRNDVMWIAAQAAFSQERSDILAEALRQAVALRLGRHASQRGYAEEGLRFSREGGVEDAETRGVAGAYSRAVNSVWNRLHESFVDQYNAINRLVETMEKSSGKAAKAFEDIRLALNQQGSRALAAMNEWVRKYNTPMWDAIKVLMKEKGCDLKAVERYVMIKHALERNEVFARRDARDYYRAQHDARVEAIGRSDDSQAEKDAAIAREDTRLRRRYADIDAGTDIKYLEFREHDYGGLTGLFSDYGPDFAPQRKGESDEDYNRRALAARRPMFEKDVETGTHLGDGSPVTRKVADIARIEAEARREVAAFESGHADAVDELWQRINAATKATLRHQYESNVISRAQYEEVSGMFEHYVPLRGFADRTAEDLYDYYNSDQGGSFAPPLLRARGRRTESESPFGYIGAMASSGIAQDMKNQAKLALYYFVSNRKGNGVISVSQMWFEKSGEKDAQGRAVFVPAYPPFSESLDAETGKKAYEDWEKMMQEKAKSGLAFRGKGRLGLDGVVHIDKGHEAEHVIPFKLGGRDLAMYVNGSPRAAQAVNGTLNYDSQSNVIIDTLNQILRTMAALNTQLNPEFWISNFQRDALFALMAVSVKEDPGYNRAFRRNLAKARGVIGLRRRYNNGTLGTGRVEDYYREFVEGGGVTGYTVVYDNDYWEKKLREYSGEDRNVIGRILGSLDGITDLGEGIEQMTRFAAYMTSRERGKDIREAVADAKELTVNFNRKGSGRSISLKEAERLTDAHGRPLSKGAQFLVSALSNMAPYGRSMIMFFNAAVQGLNAMVRLWKKNPGRTAAWAGGYLLLGAMNAILHALFGDDDDDYLDIPDWERRNNLMLGLGGAYLKWALPQEARAFYAAGDIAVNHALGHSPHKSLLGETFAAMVDVMPVELTEGAAGLAPSAVRPIVDIWVNRDFTGARVYNENRFLSEDARKGLPEYRSALPNTPKTYVALSQALNWLSGGDSYSAGAVNINPNKVEHLVSGYSGGVGTTANKTLHLLLDVAGGDFSVRNTPFLRRVVTIPDERYGNAHTAELFYYYKGIADDTRRQMKEAMKAGDADKYGRLAGSSEAEVMNIYETFRKQLEWYGDELKATDDKEERRMLTRERDALRDEMTRQITELK